MLLKRAVRAACRLLRGPASSTGGPVSSMGQESDADPNPPICFAATRLIPRRETKRASSPAR
eukprot:4663617-Alexandrium_andersonii.AAC.1